MFKKKKNVRGSQNDLVQVRADLMSSSENGYSCYAVYGLAFQKGKDLFTRAILATGKTNSYYYYTYNYILINDYSMSPLGRRANHKKALKNGREKYFQKTSEISP